MPFLGVSRHCIVDAKEEKKKPSTARSGKSQRLFLTDPTNPPPFDLRKKESNSTSSELQSRVISSVGELDATVV